MKEVLLIGNGPSCLNNEFGELIDSHETIVRFNDFITKGYEEYVGSKTDVWVKTKKSIKHDNDKFKHKYYVHPRVLNSSDNELSRLHEKGYEIIPVNFHDNIDKLIKGNSWATTGLVMIYYFMEMGYKVSIHGFDFFENGVHYYNDGSKMVGHKPDLEKEIVTNLIKNKKIKVLRYE